MVWVGLHLFFLVLGNHMCIKFKLRYSKLLYKHMTIAEYLNVLMTISWSDQLGHAFIEVVLYTQEWWISGPQEIFSSIIKNFLSTWFYTMISININLLFQFFMMQPAGLNVGWYILIHTVVNHLHCVDYTVLKP